MPSLTDPVVPGGRMRALGQPTLEAGGMAVRPWQANDAPAVLEAYRDPAIRYWHVRSMADLAEAAHWIGSWPRRWQDETGADWAVTTENSVVGRIGLKRLDLWDGTGEVAYWTVPAARGLGVAPRAIDAVTRWAVQVLGLHRLELTHSVRNPASCRAAGKAGFDAEGTLRGQGHHSDGWHDMHVHGRVFD